MRVLCRRTTPDDFGRNRWANISIPVLRVEDDVAGSFRSLEVTLFQSTSSVWRTTVPSRLLCVSCVISIHVLRVEDDPDTPDNRARLRISIHVLRVEDNR